MRRNNRGWKSFDSGIKAKLLKEFEDKIKSAKQAKLLIKRLNKTEIDHDAKVNYEGIKTFTEMGIYNPDIAIDSHYYEYQIKIGVEKIRIDNCITAETRNTPEYIHNKEEVQKVLEQSQRKIIEIKSIYTLELLDNDPISIFDRNLLPSANSILEKSTREFFNLESVSSKINDNTKLDNETKTMLNNILSKLYKFIINKGSDVDNYSYFINELCSNLYEYNKDPGVSKLIKESYKKKKWEC